MIMLARPFEMLKPVLYVVKGRNNERRCFQLVEVMFPPRNVKLDMSNSHHCYQESRGSHGR